MVVVGILGLAAVTAIAANVMIWRLNFILQEQQEENKRAQELRDIRELAFALTGEKYGK